MEKYKFGTTTVQSILQASAKMEDFDVEWKRSSSTDDYSDEFMQAIAEGKPTAPFIIWHRTDENGNTAYTLIDGRTRWGWLLGIVKTEGYNTFRPTAEKLKLVDADGKPTELFLSYELPVLFLYGDRHEVMDMVRTYGIDERKS